MLNYYSNNMYKILYNYGTEGYKFYEDEFYNVRNAVAKAIELNYCVEFTIVKIIKWEAIEK